MIPALLATTMLTQSWIYPPTKTVNHTDTYHGITVADPYRWLEQPITTPEVKAWADAQNELTNRFLNQIPNRKPLLDELLRRVNYERFDIPVQKGTRTFYGYNSGLLPQNVIYVVDRPGATPRILLDPNTLSADGTVALSGTDFNNDGSRMLYGVSKAGSDWIEWNVLDVTTGKTIGQPVKWSKFGGAVMNSDGTGFYYLRYPAPKVTPPSPPPTKTPQSTSTASASTNQPINSSTKIKPSPKRSSSPQWTMPNKSFSSTVTNQAQPTTGSGTPTTMANPSPSTKSLMPTMPTTPPWRSAITDSSSARAKTPRPEKSSPCPSPAEQ
ncbi:hypothetical protein CCB80_00480 [Armatimonadetes bacterium Uphvl-Ar1]|nr:hypothetical protein CCB80_00480 [Armatimonadetes bacterium Uphvl-Ar1]